MKNKIILPLIFLAGCGTVQLTEKGRKVVILDANVQVCDVIDADHLVSSFRYESNILSMKNELQNEAAELGGNAVKINEKQESIIIATIYKCPSKYLEGVSSQLEQ